MKKQRASILPQSPWSGKKTRQHRQFGGFHKRQIATPLARCTAMLKLARVTVPPLLVTLISGCVPLPHFDYLAPAASGVITQDGFPITDAQVQVSSQFSDERMRAITGADGRFATESIRRFSFFMVLLGDPIHVYSVKITTGDKTYEGYSTWNMGYAPEKIELRCDLSCPLKSRDGQEYCASEEASSRPPVTPQPGTCP
ncbi:MAG: carboxypeptidase-like regulatory domain-containing protein [Zoogloeaceae bacterium]|jgi:hypothetical protein|nr:carboxypeptidase-like regulatory domain-containing protein [Zoogloeaceae bacterium]